MARTWRRALALAVCALVGPLGCAEATAPASADAAVGVDGGSDVGGAAGDAAADASADGAGPVDTAAPDAGADAGADAGDPTRAEAPSQLTFSAPKSWTRPTQAWLDAAAKAGGVAVDPALRGLAPGPAPGEVLLAYGHAGPGGPALAADLLRLDPAGLGELAAPGFDGAITGFRRQGEALYALSARPLKGDKGSLYRYPAGGPWQRFETVPLAERIDVVRVVGQTVVLGGVAKPSGGQPSDHRFATLWRSDDGGAFFEIVYQRSNGGVGQARFRCLAEAGGLVALGERTGADGQVVELPHLALPDGAAPASLGVDHPLKALRPLACADAADGSTLLGAEDVLAPGDAVLMRLSAAGAVAIDVGAWRMVAAWPHAGSGETLLLESHASGAVRVRALRPDGGFVTLLAETSGPSDGVVTALAWRPGHLLIATSAGELLRAPGSLRASP